MERRRRCTDGLAANCETIKPTTNYVTSVPERGLVGKVVDRAVSGESA